jgi:hypothetical protein
MRRVRRRVIGAAIVAIASCSVMEAYEVSEQAAYSDQGSDLQGSDLQGSDLQGSDLQGSDLQSDYYQARWQSTALGSAMYGVSNVGSAALNGGTLSFWRFTRQANGAWGYDQHFPDRICHWNISKSAMSGCDLVDLATSPSPVAGASFSAQFIDRDGNPFEARVRIGLSTTQVGAVAEDAKIAMATLKNLNYPLQVGQLNPAACTVVAYGQQGCTNAKGCRVNCDVWQYDVRFVDLLDEEGNPRRFCPDGHRAVAVPGTYNQFGAHDTSDPSKFTFACTSGTIAKCTRWGYRPYGKASKTCEAVNCSATDNTQYELHDYHQTCVRAARADYCASNHSYTKPGTVIDIYDNVDPAKPGFRFVHPTFRVLTTTEVTAFVTESTFDRASATGIDHLRYQEMLGTWPSLVANDCFSSAYADVNGTLKRNTAATPPTLGVESTTACSHDETTLGRTLHESCSPCTKRIAELDAPPWTYRHCTSFSPDGWDAACVSRAQAVCNEPSPTLVHDRMAMHSECTTGMALNALDTGCTLKVCSENAACCDTASPLAKNAWGAACVEVANAKCFGGQENASVGFCGTPYP